MNDEKILYILVIGFHHKKGCQLEFSYPPLESLPEQWKHLPHLALPDGAHRYSSDYVFLHLPGIDSPRTVFGISCFRQIPIEDVKNRTEDMTRTTVQKALCVLTNVPLYGYIQNILDGHTKDFFETADFSRTQGFEQVYHDFEQNLPGKLENNLFQDLPVSDLIKRFQHKTLILFKLILLEKKVVFYHSPVRELCGSLMALLSLHPGVIKYGLHNATSTSSVATPVDDSTAIRSSKFDDLKESCESNGATDGIAEASVDVKEGCENEVTNVKAIDDFNVTTNYANQARIDIAQTRVEEIYENKPTDLVREGGSKDSIEEAVEAQEQSLASAATNYYNELLTESQMEAYGLPLKIFESNNFCFPYLSISYLDFLLGPSVRGFVVGASNVLFKHKGPIDVLVEIKEATMVSRCPKLAEQLKITAEDHRFMDHVLLGINKGFNDDWIRTQFQHYMISLLHTKNLPAISEGLKSFNSDFILAWRGTHNYKTWSDQKLDIALDSDFGHPGFNWKSKTTEYLSKKYHDLGKAVENIKNIKAGEYANLASNYLSGFLRKQ